MADETVRALGIELAELVAYLERYLEIDAIEDAGPNGLQVEGRSPVRRLATGVSASRELFARARERGADALLVHHGLFWSGDPRVLTGGRYARVVELIDSQMALLAYHLPLDRHLEVGNNAVAARRLGLGAIEPFGAWRGVEIGVRGRFAEPLSAGELERRCGELFGQPPLAFREGPERISSLGLVSGAGARMLDQAVDLGLDAFVTGEPREWVLHQAREAGIHFLACGHYATERLGVQALGEHLAARFPLQVEFVEVPNPV